MTLEDQYMGKYYQLINFNSTTIRYSYYWLYKQFKITTEVNSKFCYPKSWYQMTEYSIKSFIKKTTYHRNQITN